MTARLKLMTVRFQKITASSRLDENHHEKPFENPKNHKKNS
jgi:hypothetical protein